MKLSLNCERFKMFFSFEWELFFQPINGLRSKGFSIHLKAVILKEINSNNAWRCVKLNASEDFICLNDDLVFI